MAKKPSGVMLGRGTYQATQVGAELLLTAKGVHPTTGFRELFEPHDLTAPVHRFDFFFIKPSGIVSDVITPFLHQERFRVQGRPESVVISDVDGKHRVAVTRVAAMEEMKAAMAAAPAAEEGVDCDEQVRQAIGGWAQNEGFDDDQTLDDIIRNRPCDNGQLIALAQLLRAQFSVSLSFSCSTLVIHIIRQICGG